MKLIMKLDGIKYEKEKIIKTFKEAGVNDEDFFKRFTTKKRIVYARYENHKDFCVWTSGNIKETTDGLKTFASFISNKDYVELRYDKTNEIYVGEI